MQVVQPRREGRTAAGIGSSRPNDARLCSHHDAHCLQVKIQKHLLWILNKPGFRISSGFRTSLQPWAFPTQISTSFSCANGMVCASLNVPRALDSPEHHSLSGISSVRGSAFYSYNLFLKTSFSKRDTGKWTPDSFYGRLL